ncbi:TonB-dependent receptor, partial [Polaribacter reichenbachii]
VLNDLEKKTAFKFFYKNEWIDNETITKSYHNKSLKDILKDIFTDKPINFYFIENKIIFTKNNYIRDDSLFNSSNDNKSFFDENEFNDPDIIKIGKESKNNKKSKFTLKGYLKDENTNELLKGILISVKGQNTNTQTNIKGYYEIELKPGFNILRFHTLPSIIEEKKILMFNDGNFDFSFTNNSVELEEVVISANSNQNVKEAVTGLVTIHVKNIKTIPTLLGVSDIFRVATTLPGITTAGEGASGFNVRGGKADQNLILLDNSVIYNPSHFFGIFSGINPSTSGNVDIFKGSMPAEYGGRLSSVFDINTKNGNTTEFTGDISVGPVMSNFSIENPIVKNKSSLLVGGRITHSNWLLKSINNENLKNSQASFYDIIANYSHKINDNNNIKISSYYSKDQYSITSDSLYNYSNKLISFNWQHKINEYNKAKLSISNSRYQFGIDYESQNSILDKSFTLNYEISDSELNYKINYSPNKTHHITYGISGKLYAVTPGNLTPINNTNVVPVNLPKEKGLLFALYASDKFEINDKLLLNFGFRGSLYSFLGPAEQRIYEENLPLSSSSLLEVKEYGKNEFIKNYFGPEYRLSLRYFLKENVSIKASFNNVYQYIHTLSNNTTPSPTDTWKLSDLNIKPQESIQYSLGVYTNTLNNQYEFSLEGYYKNFDNILDYKVGAKLLLNEAIETEILQGTGKAYGIELLLKKTTGKLNGWVSYTYSRSLNKFFGEFNEEIINSGEYFPSNFDKPHDLSLVTNFKFSKRLSISTNFFYQTGRPVTYPVGNYLYNGPEYVLYSDRNKFRIDDYYRLDLSFNFEGNHKLNKAIHTFWNFSIYNVLGRNNPYSVFFQNIDGNVKAFQSTIFSQPVPTISFNLKF